ncbi:MAG: hypothetical protein U0935_13685 [Pirellulales bacterium]
MKHFFVHPGFVWVRRQSQALSDGSPGRRRGVVKRGWRRGIFGGISFSDDPTVNPEGPLLSGKWSQVREGLDGQLVPTESGAETFIVCRSLDRDTKERAIRERFEARMEKGLSRIQAACEKRCYQVGVIERRIGRLLAKNSRATGLYEVTVKTGEKGGAQLAWSKKSNQAELLQRARMLRVA